MPDKVDFCRKWYELGVCPGCGAALEKVAGQSVRHYRGRDKVFGRNGPRTTYAGELTSLGGKYVTPTDERLCPWSADDLTSLVLIGSGVVGYGGVSGDAALVRERRDPAIASAIVSEGGNK